MTGAAKESEEELEEIKTLREIEEAKKTIEHIRRLHPEFDIDPRAPFVTRRMPADFIESIMKGLRKAGYDVPPA